uniref:Golgi-associated plant pathogenesis-related protein 1 n=1 Tax=Sipha flava TaxID=143950 RepID=A0A2S2Q4X9_9HEMI
MARQYFSCQLLITLCVVIKSIKAENLHDLNRTNKVLGQLPITEDYDEESESPEIKYSSSSSSSFPSRLSSTILSNSSPKNPERIVPAELSQNKISLKNSNLRGLSKTRNSRNSNDNSVTNPIQPSASYLPQYPNFQDSGFPIMPNYETNPFGGIFSSPFSSTHHGSPFAMRGSITNPFGNGGFGGMVGDRVLVFRKCCDNFNNCRMLKENEVCGPEIFSSPPSSLSSSPVPPSSKFLSPYDSPENSDHKRDENISPESLNRKHDRKYSGPENRNSKTQSMPLSAFPLDFLKKQMGNYGPQNTRVISFRKCCVNGQCLDILPDEECGDAKFMEKLKNKPKTHNQYEDNGMSNFNNMMNGNLNQYGKIPFGIINYSDDNSVEIPQSGKQNKSPSGSKNQFKSGQSNVPANGMYSYNDMMQSNPIVDSENYQSKDNGINPNVNKKNKSRKHPYVESKDFTKDELQRIRKQVLDKTNAYRRKHGVTPLKMDVNLNNYAQEWANTLKSRGLKHRTDNLYGENLYKTSDSDNIGEQAVNSWYNELALYNLNDDEDELYNRSAVQHMTQLLWKSSQKLGVGVAKDDSGYIVVANYDPPGNFKRHFINNLPTFTQSQINDAKKSKK